MGDAEHTGPPACSAPLHLYCGVDVGASATKVVLLDETLAVRGRSVRPSGVDYLATARSCLEECLAHAGGDASAIASTVATGYGRHNVTFANGTSTEIQCQGIGCFHHFPQPITIVDIGGQDNKVIRLETDGRRIGFKMNRKCAAGTGAFIEEIALRLGLELADMERLASSTKDAVRLSSFCTVFAKTEILTHLRNGESAAGIVRGTFCSVVQRVMEMDPLDGQVVLTGGVIAHNPTIGEILAARLGHEVLIPPHPQLTGALGAALAAARRHGEGDQAADASDPGGPEPRERDQGG
ncbi:MAG: acyl-CoA dehydratase activase [Thermoanaerobaculales bacterium]